MTPSKLKELAMKATPGPWTLGWFESGGQPLISGIVKEEKTIVAAYSHTSDSDALHIAAANPETILKLLQERDELIAALDAITEPMGYDEEAECRALRKCHNALKASDLRWENND